VIGIEREMPYSLEAVDNEHRPGTLNPNSNYFKSKIFQSLMDLIISFFPEYSSLCSAWTMGRETVRRFFIARFGHAPQISSLTFNVETNLFLKQPNKSLILA
jgi:hypothetical protein